MPSRRGFMQRWSCWIALVTVRGCALASPVSAQPEQANYATSRPASSTTTAAPSFSTSSPWSDGGLVWLASAILHEAVHQDQANRGERPSGLLAEYAASTVQQQWLDRVGFRMNVFRTRAMLEGLDR